MDGNSDLTGRISFRYKDRTFLISRWSPQVQADYAKWVLQRARRQLKERQKDMTDYEYQREADRISREQNAGEYEWGGPIVTRTLMRARSEGGLYLFWLTLRATDPNDRTITEAFVREIAEADDVPTVSDKGRRTYPRPFQTFYEDELLPLNFPPDDPETEEGSPAPGDHATTSP